MTFFIATPLAYITYYPAYLHKDLATLVTDLNFSATLHDMQVTCGTSIIQYCKL